MKFTKWNFLMTVFGIFSLFFDIGADVWITLKYFQEGLYLFSSLTVFFIIISNLVVNVFSYAWFKDDCAEENNIRLKWVCVAHVFLSGTFVRYWYVVKYGYRAAMISHSKADSIEANKRAVDSMTDLSMLRCFKTFLESTPQLILQIYILMEHGEITLVQYASIIFSVSSISWSTVDYYMSLRNSLEDKKKIRSGFPTCTYVLYKLFTLTSWILSLVFLLACNIYVFTALLSSLWVAALIWTWKQHTEFCTNILMEILYRIVVATILVFTFFNVKGQKTRIPMSVYYSLRVLLTIGILILCFYFKQPLPHILFFNVCSITLVLALGLGLISLILYYSLFHPAIQCKDQDAVDTVLRRNRFCYFLKH
ncbi:hypothetical protein GDO86_010939 [Hymenochirus boettgeri]|uniref:XK-related protein n=1 Tax=Hymenochirus boettgeri TaxID=247094 RepID=A0A8T2JE96_9PIPI|nr:hypothetical protein GDO86_010939 [Hymenochirus boettgeri]KAG8441944.1 hypothetical protein GDO86_010939 [Hymenochirus boettgeri]